MFEEQLTKIGKGARKKAKLINNTPIKYLLMAMLAGGYVSLAVMLSFSLGANLHDAGSPFYKIAMGLSFGIAFLLIVFGGVELFTANNLAMTVGALREETTWKDATKIWVCCWIGNFLGIIITSFLLVQSGVVSDSIGEFVASMVSGKVSLTIPQLLIRGVLCNILVCFASWSSYRLKNEAAQILMIAWCVFTFFFAGYEHSIANMGLFALVKMVPAGASIAVGAMAKNLIVVTIGNMIGGAVILAGSFCYFANGKEEKKQEEIDTEVKEAV